MPKQDPQSMAREMQKEGTNKQLQQDKTITKAQQLNKANQNIN